MKIKNCIFAMCKSKIMIKIAYSASKEKEHTGETDSLRCPVCGKRIADIVQAEGSFTLHIKCTRCGRYFNAEVNKI